MTGRDRAGLDELGEPDPDPGTAPSPRESGELLADERGQQHGAQVAVDAAEPAAAVLAADDHEQAAGRDRAP